MKFLKTWLFAWAIYNAIFDLILVSLFLIVCFIAWEMYPINWEIVWKLGRLTLVGSGLAGLSYCFSPDGKRDWR